MRISLNSVVIWLRWRARFFRQCDRANHADSYPSLSYPELYLLEGGYKAFHEQHSRLCSPHHYVPMLQDGFEQALRQFRAECKSDLRRVRQSNGRRLVSLSRVSNVSRPAPVRLWRASLLLRWNVQCTVNMAVWYSWVECIKMWSNS